MGPKPPKPPNHAASPRFKRPKALPVELQEKHTLQDLMRELPNEMGQALNLIMLEGPDRERSFAHRTAALVGSSFLDHALQEAISLNFAQISNTLSHEIFDDRAPLSSFDAKIKMARALGIITSKQRKDLDIIRRIRNTFAHGKIDLLFEMKEIADECYKLTYETHPREINLEKYDTTPGMMFANTVWEIYYILMKVYPEVRKLDTSRETPSPQSPVNS